MVTTEIKNWIRIRRSVPDDADTLWEIDKRNFSLPWSRDDFVRDLGENILATYLIAEIKDKIVGYIGVWVVVNECHIMTIATEHKWRRQGIGTMLLHEVMNQSRTAGADRFTLEVRRSNDAAIALYEKFGFKIVGYRRDYYEDNKEDAAIMWMIDR